MQLLWVGIIIGLFFGLRIGGWWAFKKLGTHEFRQRQANVKRVSRF